MRPIRRSLLPLLFLACGNQSAPGGDEGQALTQLQEELHQANAVIDSLNYTVDASNQIIDGLRAQVTSLQKIDARLYDSVQRLSAELRDWRSQADEQRRRNQAMSAELEQLRRQRGADQQTIARLRREADSLNAALLDANGALRRQVGHLDALQEELALARRETDQAQRAAAEAQQAGRAARLGVHLYAAGEDSLLRQGYLEAGRKMFRRAYRLIKPLDPADPRLRLTPIGEPLVLEGDLRGLADRYGRLREGRDFVEEKTAGRVQVTFTNPLLQGAEVVAIVGE